VASALRPRKIRIVASSTSGVVSGLLLRAPSSWFSAVRIWAGVTGFAGDGLKASPCAARWLECTQTASTAMAATDTTTSTIRWTTTRRWYECPMHRRRRAAVAASCLALLFPAAAFAGGSAGDNQYQDPLGNSPPQTKTTTQRATTPAPPPAPPPAATTTTPRATSTVSSGDLPRTGLPLGPMIALGAGLIAAGLLIRRLA
jgi:hypothetical protein